MPTCLLEVEVLQLRKAHVRHKRRQPLQHMQREQLALQRALRCNHLQLRPLSQEGQLSEHSPRSPKKATASEKPPLLPQRTATAPLTEERHTETRSSGARSSSTGRQDVPPTGEGGDDYDAVMKSLRMRSLRRGSPSPLGCSRSFQAQVSELRSLTSSPTRLSLGGAPAPETALALQTLVGEQEERADVIVGELRRGRGRERAAAIVRVVAPTSDASLSIQMSTSEVGAHSINRAPGANGPDGESSASPTSQTAHFAHPQAAPSRSPTFAKQQQQQLQQQEQQQQQQNQQERLPLGVPAGLRSSRDSGFSDDQHRRRALLDSLDAAGGGGDGGGVGGEGRESPPSVSVSAADAHLHQYASGHGEDRRRNSEQQEEQNERNSSDEERDMEHSRSVNSALHTSLSDALPLEREAEFKLVAQMPGKRPAVTRLGSKRSNGLRQAIERQSPTRKRRTSRQRRRHRTAANKQSAATNERRPARSDRVSQLVPHVTNVTASRLMRREAPPSPSRRSRRGMGRGRVRRQREPRREKQQRPLVERSSSSGSASRDSRTLQPLSHSPF